MASLKKVHERFSRGILIESEEIFETDLYVSSPFFTLLFFRFSTPILHPRGSGAHTPSKKNAPGRSVPRRGVNEARRFERTSQGGPKAKEVTGTFRRIGPW